MSSNSDVIARSPDGQSGRRGNLSGGRDCFASLAMTTRVAAQELLPVLLIFYPLLLLLDDLEPGFVRSVVNPHAFLLALIVVGMIAGREMASPSPTPPRLRGTSRSPSRGEGEKLRMMFALAAAIVAGFWAWWRVGGGRIGVIVGLLTVVVVGGAAAAVVGNPKSEYRNPKQ